MEISFVLIAWNENKIQYRYSLCCASFVVFISGEYCDSLKSLSLKFLLVLATGTDNISQNTVLEYLTINCNFDAVIQVRLNYVFMLTVQVLIFIS